MQSEAVSVRPHNRAPILIEPLERRQLLAAGVLDTTFRSTGRFASSSSAGEFNDLAVAPDGSIFVASGSDRLTAYKFLPSGQPDTNFGPVATAGRVSDIVVSGNNFQGAASLTLQSDGKLILGGETFVNGTGAGKSVVARYTASGATDTTWNGTGKIELSVAGKIQLQLSKVVLQSDGKVIVIATVNSDFYVARLTSTGTLDPSFDGDGYKIFSFPQTNGVSHFGDHAYDGIVTPDEKILIVGTYLRSDPFNSYQRGIELARLNTDGSFDTTFDQDGMAVTFGPSIGVSSGRNVALQADGRILVGAQFDDSPSVLRYNTNGSIDTTFDSDGVVKLPGQAYGDVAVQPNGQIIAGSEASPAASSTVLTRFNSNGSLDSGFGIDGVATLSWSTLLGSSTQYVRDIEVQPDGKVLLGVSTDGITDTNAKWGLARYLTDVPGPAIAGTVCGDWNDNGVVEAGESAAGVQVYLDSNHNNTLDSGEPVTTSDSSGRYKFADLALGIYDVREVVPGGYLALSPSTAEQTVTIIAGDPGPTSADFTNRPTSALPLVTGSNYLYDSSPNVVTFTFAVALDVNSLQTSDLVLTRDGAGEVPLVQSVQWNAANKTATFVLAAGALQNDAYHATLPSGSVTNVAGLAIPVVAAAEFFSLAGDGNHNRSVEIQDFNLLATNFGKSGMKFSQGNYDYSSDGQITILDFNILASNFGKSVPQATTAMRASLSSPTSPAVFAPTLRYDLLDEAQLI